MSQINDREIDIECRLLPHGPYTIIPTVLSTIAWIVSLAQDGCDYAILTGSSTLSLTNDAKYVELGFNAYRVPEYDASTKSWSIAYTGPCYAYSNHIPIDATWRWAKTMAFLAIVVGGGGTLFIWMSNCFVFGSGTWRWAGYEILAASIFQIFSFFWFGTDICQRDYNECSFSVGAKLDIVAAVFWSISAAMILFKYPRPDGKEKVDLGFDEEDEAIRGIMM